MMHYSMLDMRLKNQHINQDLKYLDSETVIIVFVLHDCSKIKTWTAFCILNTVKYKSSMRSVVLVSDVFV